MKINILKMNFVDRKRYFLERQIEELVESKRTHLIIGRTDTMPTTLTYLTSRIRDKKLKHKHRPIPVIIRNKSYVKQL